MIEKGVYDSYLSKIGEAAPDNEEVTTIIEEFGADRTELLNELDNAKAMAYDDKGELWKDKFIAMNARYRERFLTGEEIKEKQEEDVKKDDSFSKVSFDDLFKNRESDVK